MLVKGAFIPITDVFVVVKFNTALCDAIPRVEPYVIAQASRLFFALLTNIKRRRECLKDILCDARIALALITLAYCYV